ncbi:AAA family ATPase [Streptomyces melanogenes]|uniref:AAA family ATPase n=1 Tax=Streptomyces melanogenes TaxID=67326 RepID=UPI0037A8B146
MKPLERTIPDPALIVLIGAAGSGKSTLARTWPATQVLELDHFRAMVSDCPGDQEATADAVDALHLLLERRLARHLNTVIDATNVTRQARAALIAAARRHGMPAVAVLVSTPADVCVERQGRRPANRAVPEDVVRAQHKAALHAHPSLLCEGFDEVVFASRLHRLLPHLRRLSQARTAELGLDGGDGLGDLLLVRGFFGPQILPLWRWKPASDVAGGDRVGEIRLGQQYLTLALRTDVDGDLGFDVMVPCPFDPECCGYAWVPAFSINCLYHALTGELDNHQDIVCTLHGGRDDADLEADDHDLQDDVPEGRADPEAQYTDAVRA